MDTTTVRRLLRAMGRPQSDETVRAIASAQTDPDAARTLWHLLLTAHIKDDRLQDALQWVLESVLIDYVTNHMDNNDDYALVIGRRMTKILEAIERPEPEEYPKTA